MIVRVRRADGALNRGHRLPDGPDLVILSPVDRRPGDDTKRQSQNRYDKAHRDVAAGSIHADPLSDSARYGIVGTPRYGVAVYPPIGAPETSFTPTGEHRKAGGRHPNDVGRFSMTKSWGPSSGNRSRPETYVDLFRGDRGYCGQVVTLR